MGDGGGAVPGYVALTPPAPPPGPADQSPLSLCPPNSDPGACSLMSPSVLQSPPQYTSPSSVPALPKASRRCPALTPKGHLPCWPGSEAHLDHWVCLLLMP